MKWIHLATFCFRSIAKTCSMFLCVTKKVLIVTTRRILCFIIASGESGASLSLFFFLMFTSKKSNFSRPFHSNALRSKYSTSFFIGVSRFVYRMFATVHSNLVRSVNKNKSNTSRNKKSISFSLRNYDKNMEQLLVSWYDWLYLSPSFKYLFMGQSRRNSL